MATVVSKKESKKESENASEKRSKYVQRTIRFNKFRNIGLDEPQDLVLNSNFEKGNMGNLLVLIGSNNSGKSNVLDGILKLNDKKLSDRDRTDLSFNDEDMNPSISLWYKNEKDNFGYVIDLKNGGKWKINQTSLSKAEVTETDITIPKDIVLRELKAVLQLHINYGYDKKDYPQIKQIQEITEKISADTQYKFTNYQTELFDIFGWIESSNLPKRVNFWAEIENYETVSFCLRNKGTRISRHFVNSRGEKYDGLGLLSASTAEEELKEIIDLLKASGSGENTQIIHQLEEIIESCKHRAYIKEYDYVEDYNIDKLADIFDKFKKKGLKLNAKNTGIWTDYSATFKLYQTVSAYLNRDKNILGSPFSEIFGVSTIPTVHRYQQNTIDDLDLTIDLNNTDISTISQSKFFKALFNSFEDFNVNSISTAYNRLNETHNSAILDKLEKEVKPGLNTINDRFNKLYFASNDKYKFTLKFESSRISFGMARGKDEDPIRLEYQSTGFRWFFDFYFNFIANNNLKPGDIVIMDEPATNLHPQGQAELRKFIKEFAVKNDILFIIATHSPFLIDTDNYDELRVVSMENNRSTIDNLFTVVNDGDPDTLLPIKESLTIKQNVLYDLDTEVVWVEGLTDYIYLTMFKNILNSENMEYNMAFLPFNGAGTSKEGANGILKRILKIKFNKRSLLVDADKAGKDMYNLAQESDFKNRTYKISDVKISGNKDAKVIEDLFSSEDREKYKWIIDNKKTLFASELKIHAKKEDFSKETLDNFRKLFMLIQEGHTQDN